MPQSVDLKHIVDQLGQLRQTAEELKCMSGEIPSIECNVERLMAVVRVLELGFCDIVEI